MDVQANHLSSARASRLVAAGRAVLACVLLASVMVADVVDDSVRLLLGGYLAYALAVFALVRFRRMPGGALGHPLLLTGLDVAVFTAVLYLTKGADSPYFSPLIFIVLSATIQWGWRGALSAGLLVLAVFLPTGFAIAGGETSDTAVLQFVVRVGNLGVVTVLLAAFGRHVERVVGELARLSDPVPDGAATTAQPPVRPCLEHALGVFAARRGAFVWTEDEEPWTHLAMLDADGVFRRSRLDGGHAAWVDGDAISDAAFLYDRSRGATFVRRNGRSVSGPSGVLSAEALAALDFQRALVIKANAEGFDGRLFILDHEDAANEDLAVGAMVSAQISVALERWRAALARQSVAAGEERIRLARDLHDGVLQFLAGAALHLDAVTRTPGLPDDARERISGLRAALKDEQRELRGFIAAMRPAGAASREPPRPLADELEMLGDRLARHWGVDVRVNVEPRTAVIPAELAFDVTRIVREAVANAVRHGSASTVSVEARGEGEGLTLSITDDGKGFPVAGRLTDEDMAETGQGPRSLRERARALGGRLQVVSDPGGAAVTVALPLQKAS